MKRNLTISILLILVAFPALSFAQSAKQGFGFDRNSPYDRVNNEIHLRNLVNGLSLSAEQSDQLLNLAIKAEKLIEKMNKKTKKAKKDGTEALSRINDALKNNEKPPADALSQARKSKEDLSAILKEPMNRIRELEKKARAVLTVNQQAILKNFKPCLVPPKNSQNPSPAGAANDGGHFERVLTRMYTLNDEIFNEVSARLMNRHINKIEQRFGPMSESEIQVEQERIMGILTRTRAMEKTDFELNKTELALEIEEPIHAQEVNRNDAIGKIRTKWHLRKTGRWLLNPAIIPILEKK